MGAWQGATPHIASYQESKQEGIELISQTLSLEVTLRLMILERTGPAWLQGSDRSAAPSLSQSHWPKLGQQVGWSSEELDWWSYSLLVKCGVSRGTNQHTHLQAVWELILV